MLGVEAFQACSTDRAGLDAFSILARQLGPPSAGNPDKNDTLQLGRLPQPTNI